MRPLGGRLDESEMLGSTPYTYYGGKGHPGTLCSSGLPGLWGHGRAALVPHPAPTRDREPFLDRLLSTGCSPRRDLPSTHTHAAHTGSHISACHPTSVKQPVPHAGPLRPFQKKTPPGTLGGPAGTAPANPKRPSAAHGALTSTSRCPRPG